MRFRFNRVQGMLIAIATAVAAVSTMFVAANTAVVTPTPEFVAAPAPTITPTTPASKPEPCLSNSNPFYFANVPTEAKESPWSFGPPVTVQKVDNTDRKSAMYTATFKPITAKPQRVGMELVARLCGRAGWNGERYGNIHGGDMMLYLAIMSLDERDPNAALTRQEWEDGVEYLVRGGGIKFSTMRTEHVTEKPRGYSAYMEPAPRKGQAPRLGVSKFTHWQSWITYVDITFRSGRTVKAELRDDCGFQLRFTSLDKVPTVLRSTM